MRMPTPPHADHCEELRPGGSLWSPLHVVSVSLNSEKMLGVDGATPSFPTSPGRILLTNTVASGDCLERAFTIFGVALTVDSPSPACVLE